MFITVFMIFSLLFFYWSYEEIVRWHLAQIPEVPRLKRKMEKDIIEIISPACMREDAGLPVVIQDSQCTYPFQVPIFSVIIFE